MRRPLGRFMRDLGLSRNEVFADLLAGHLDITRDAASLIRDAIAGTVPLDRAYERMKELEHEGDAARGTLVVELAAALVTPIDREDVFRLSRSIDDVLDDLRDLMREWTLFRADDARFLGPVLEAVVRAVDDLRTAVSALAPDPRSVVEATLLAKKSCNRLHRLYQVTMARLLREPLTTELLKRRELLRRVEDVGRHLDDAADVLSDAAVKRSV